MKRFLIAAFTAVASFAPFTVNAQSVTTSEQKYAMCRAVLMANSDGISGKYMIKQMLERRGQPGYMANVVMNDIKPVCPRAY